MPNHKKHQKYLKWLMSICQKYKLSPNIFQTTVLYMYKFLSLDSDVELENHLKYIVLVCLHLATKSKDGDYIVHIKNCQKLYGVTFEKQQFDMILGKVLLSLQFLLYIETPIEL